MSRESFKEICPLYKQLDDKYHGITMDDLKEIFRILNLRNPAIKCLTRREKRKKELIIDRLNNDMDIIKRYISQIVPVDESNGKILTHRERGKKNSWKFLDELDTSITQDVVVVMNILDQEDDLSNQGEVEFISSLELEYNQYSQEEMGFIDSLFQEDNLCYQDEVVVTNSLDQEDNQYNQGEVVVANSLDQESNLYNHGEVEYIDNLDQEHNQYNQGEVAVTNSLDQGSNQYNQGELGFTTSQREEAQNFPDQINNPSSNHSGSDLSMTKGFCSSSSLGINFK